MKYCSQTKFHLFGDWGQRHQRYLQTMTHLHRYMQLGEEAGVQEVFVSALLTRADFAYSNPPGLTKARFDLQRKETNGLLREKYGDRFIKFREIRCP